MKAITRKSEIKEELERCFLSLENGGIDSFVATINKRILSSKVKFPLLEYCGQEIIHRVNPSDHLAICHKLTGSQTIGENVLIGTILKLRLENDFDESIDEAIKFISLSWDWYVSDIIGERVFGHAFLNYPGRMLDTFDKLKNHESKWVVRAIGSGCHNAIKWGLPKSEAEEAFKTLLELGDSKDYQIRRGIGWAAKTTAKFHPDIIQKYEEAIHSKHIGSWFRTKIKIGLSRHSYGLRN